MLEHLYIFFANRPAVLRAAATALWKVGCAGLLAGVLAGGVNAVLSVVTFMSGVEANNLALIPGMPTWWIPESVLGVGFYLSLFVGAYMLADLARQLKRLHRF